MAKNNRPPLEMEGLTDNLKRSSGRGADAFFPTPDTAPSTPPVEKENNQPVKDVEARNVSVINSTSINKKINKTSNNGSNIVSNITILQITDGDISSLRELAEKPQTYRLNSREIEYIKDTAYKLTKESKRGKIGQGDILRIALLLFEKFITSNKSELKEILERIK